MKDNSKYIPEIINKLKKINPYKIILFGSYANRSVSEDSDIDLVVILDSPEIAKNYDEKMKNKSAEKFYMNRNRIYENKNNEKIFIKFYYHNPNDIS
ncbi:MAG: nucleotidyltransferase domain-containing protein [Candidatus Anammoxibacter sp.]